MAMFFVQFKDDSFKRQMKENRKIEDLILMFAARATGVLKNEPSLAGDRWKIELNNHIVQFVKMLRECLRGIGHVSPELLSRLDTYAAKLAPSQSASDSGYDSASTSRDSMGSPSGSGGSIRDMPMVRAVALLFKIPEFTVQREVDQLRQFCTEKVTDLVLSFLLCLSSLLQAALTDLKVSARLA
jgi:hypothetical protein